MFEMLLSNLQCCFSKSKDIKTEDENEYNEELERQIKMKKEIEKRLEKEKRLKNNEVTGQINVFIEFKKFISFN